MNNADFGRAYFSSGHITRFLLRLFREYTVLFIGYSLNDPPIAYILDALGSEVSGRKHYIFVDAGSAKEATNYDNNDSIKIIEYSLRGKSHDSLYDTLENWANAHQDMKGYIKKDIIAKFAHFLPEELGDLEKDQVIWAFRNDSDKLDGALAFYNHEPTPPVEWLEVFKEKLSDKLEKIFIESANISNTERLIFAWMLKHLDKIEMVDWIAENNGRYKYLNSHFRHFLRTILGIPHKTGDSHFPLSELSPAFAKFWSIIASDSNFARSYLENGSRTVMNFIHNPNNDIAQIEFLAALKPVLHITKMQSHDLIKYDTEFFNLVATDVELQCQQRGKDNRYNMSLLLSYTDIYCIAFPTLLPEIEKKYLRAIELDLRYTKEHQFGDFRYDDYKYHVLMDLLDISWNYINLSLFNEEDILNKFDILSRWVGYGLTPFTYLAAQCLSQVRESEADQAFEIIKKIGIYYREEIDINGKRINNDLPYKNLLGRISIIRFVCRIFKYLRLENQNYIIDCIINSHPYSDSKNYNRDDRDVLQKIAKFDICENLEILSKSGVILPDHANDILANKEKHDSQQDLYSHKYEPRQKPDFNGKKATEILEIIAQNPEGNSLIWNKFNSPYTRHNLSGEIEAPKPINKFRAIAVLFGLKNHTAGQFPIVWRNAINCIEDHLSDPIINRRVIPFLRQIPIDLLVDKENNYQILNVKLYFSEKKFNPNEEAILFWKLWHKHLEFHYTYERVPDIQSLIYGKKVSRPDDLIDICYNHPARNFFKIIFDILSQYKISNTQIDYDEIHRHADKLLDYSNENTKYSRYLMAHYLNDNYYGGQQYGYLRHDRDFILNHFIPFFDWKHPAQDAAILWQLIDFPYQNLLFYPPLWEKINGYFFDSFEHISGFPKDAQYRFIHFAFFAGIRFHDDNNIMIKLRTALKHCPAELLADGLYEIARIMYHYEIQEHFNCLPSEIADNHFAAQSWFWQNRLWPVINQAWPRDRKINTANSVENFLNIIANCGDSIADALTKLRPYLYQLDEYGFTYYNDLTHINNIGPAFTRKPDSLKTIIRLFQKT